MIRQPIISTKAPRELSPSQFTFFPPSWWQCRALFASLQRALHFSDSGMASSLASRSFTLATFAPRACLTKSSLYSSSCFTAPIRAFCSCNSTDLTSLSRPSLQGFAPKKPTSATRDVSGIRAMATQVEKSDQEWRAVLSPEQFRVLRQKGTE